VSEPPLTPAPALAAQAGPEVAAEVAAEPTPPAAEPEVTLAEQLAIAQPLSTEAAALAELFTLWGLAPPATAAAACDYAASMGYSCLRNRSSWRGLQQLNHPAILELVDNAGNVYHVVLKAIDGNQAELSIGGVVVSQPGNAVADLWFGNYLLLWRPPNGVAVSLVPGVRHANVVWLRASLAAIDPRYRAEPLSSDIYDQDLARRVREFQRDQRLDVDGLAGQQTQILINTLLAADDAPRLTATAPRLAQE
jgi:general secretion pathway protein A